jgi:hypothetical protein
MFDHGTIPALERPPPKASAIIPDPINPTFVLFALIVAIKKREFFSAFFLSDVLCFLSLAQFLMFRVSMSVVENSFSLLSGLQF